MDGAHTHGHGPSGLAELVVLGAGIALAADILARVLTLLLIVLAVVGGLLLIGFIGYVVAACRRYQQATTLDAAQHHWPVVPEDPPRAVNADRCPCGRRSPNCKPSSRPPAAACPLLTARGISICTCTA